MKAKEKSPSLEEQYTEIITVLPDIPEEPNLEQPYAGRIVQTVTTYSVSDTPKQLEN